MYPVYKRIESWLEIVFYYIFKFLKFYNCNFLNVSYSNIFIQYQSGSEPLRLPEISNIFMVHLWFTKMN